MGALYFRKGSLRLFCDIDILILAPVLALAGCGFGGQSSSSPAGPGSYTGVALLGNIHGGLSPVVGATVKLYATGSSAPGTASDGYGIGTFLAEAVRQGMMHAVTHYELDAAGYWDADLATPLTAISGFHDVLSKHAHKEMVFGSRVKLLGRAVKRSAVRHYLGRVFATAASITLRLPIYDTQCGAKLFRVNDHLKKVFGERFLSKWVFDVEVVARYSRLYGHSVERMESCVYEYALKEWADVAGSKVRPRDFFTAMLDLTRIKFRYFWP